MQDSVMAGIFTALSLIASAPANPHAFAANCRFEGQGNNFNDAHCQVTQTYDETQRWTHTQIQWSDGVVTAIEIQTVNRQSGDRVNSRFGLATIDGEQGQYQTFSDGGICFVIDSNRHQICYR